MNDDLLYLIALKKIPLVGDITARKLLTHFGSAQRIFAQSREKLEKLIGIGSKIADNLLHSATYLHEAEAELTFAEQHHIQVIAYTDPQYPTLLKQCPDSPILFYQKGNIQLSNKRIISIVGTRNSTPYGNAFCEKLIEELAPLGVVVVSGFAYGIDITAHKAAMKYHLQTVACLAHGLNFIYPPAHSKYVEAMTENGGFITDFGYLSAFDRKNFLSRNRIIAGLSQATVVIESGKKGGSLVTTDIASSYGREVFAVPGRVTDPYSIGCNELIHSGKANILLSAQDLINTLGWHNTPPKEVQQELFPTYTPEEVPVIQQLKKNGKMTLDSLSLACQIPVYQLSNLLFQMELKGYVHPLPGKMFEII